MSTHNQSQDVDVLIVGGGPAGLAMALDLALHKVSFRIIDKEPARSDKSRALVVQPRSLELLNRHGEAQELVARGKQVHGMTIFVNKRQTASISLDGLTTDDSEFPLPVNISQAETERFMDECLARCGHAVERALAATAFAPDDDGVTVTLERRGGGTNGTADTETETVRCKYVVGCDGAHSAVRHAAKDLQFEGAAYPQEFILCDAHLDNTKLPLDGLSLYLAHGMLVIFPLRDGLVRVVSLGPHTGPTNTNGGTTPPPPAGEAKDEAPPTLAMFQEQLEAAVPDGSAGTLRDPVWMTRFHLHHRGVNAYRAGGSGRMFVAGDAAHIHSPAGGQGMNTGMQDAVNLAWKLARALRTTTTASDNEKREALLDSYDTERRPVGRALLQGTDRVFTLAAGTGPMFLAVRNTLLPLALPWAVSGQRRREAIFAFLSEFAVSYHDAGSPLVAATAAAAATGFHGPVRGGDRAPNGMLRLRSGNGSGDRDVNLLSLCIGAPFHLLLFAGAGVHIHEEKAKTHVASRAALEGVRDRVLRSLVAQHGDLNDIVETHIVHGAAPDPSSGDKDQDQDQDGDADRLVDTDGHVHARYGFEAGPGFVLVRPDGYVAHIGPLTDAAEGELIKFMEKWV